MTPARAGREQCAATCFAQEARDTAMRLGLRLASPVKGGHRPAQRTHTLRARRAGDDLTCQPPSPSGGKDCPAPGGGVRSGGSALDVRRRPALRQGRLPHGYRAIPRNRGRFASLASGDFLQIRRFAHELRDALCQRSVLWGSRGLQRLRNVRPCFERPIAVALVAFSRLGLPALAQTPFLHCLHAPDRIEVAGRAARDLSSRFGLQPQFPQLLRKRLAPAVQVCLARVQTLAVIDSAFTLKCTCGLA